MLTYTTHPNPDQIARNIFQTTQPSRFTNPTNLQRAAAQGAYALRTTRLAEKLPNFFKNKKPTCLLRGTLVTTKPRMESRAENTNCVEMEDSSQTYEHIDKSDQDGIKTPKELNQQKILIPVLPRKRTKFGFRYDIEDEEEVRPRVLFVGQSAENKATAKIQEARSLLVEAASLLRHNKEKETSLLNLVEVFRDYTEGKRVERQANTIATQVVSLEKAARGITKATNLVRQNIATQNPTPQTQRQTYATVTKDNNKQGQPQPQTEQQKWTLVKPQKTKLQKERKHQRLIFRLQGGGSIDPRILRDKINASFKQAGKKEFQVVAAYQTEKGNLVLNFLDEQSKRNALENLQLLRQNAPILSLLEDTTWHKVVVHGVSTRDFNTPSGTEDIRKEIETFNRGLKVQGTPIWLTSQERRNQVTGGSILIAVATKEEADIAIRNQFYIGGVSCRVEYAKDKPRLARKE